MCRDELGEEFYDVPSNVTALILQAADTEITDPLSSFWEFSWKTRSKQNEFLRYLPQQTQVYLEQSASTVRIDVQCAFLE